MRTTISADLYELKNKPQRTELENAVVHCGGLPSLELTAMNAARELAQMKVIFLWVNEIITEGVAATSLGVDRLTVRKMREELTRILVKEITEVAQ